MLNKISIKWLMLSILIGIGILFTVMSLFTFNISDQFRVLGLEETETVMMADQKAKIKVASHAMALALNERH